MLKVWTSLGAVVYMDIRLYTDILNNKDYHFVAFRKLSDVFSNISTFEQVTFCSADQSFPVDCLTVKKSINTDLKKYFSVDASFDQHFLLMHCASSLFIFLMYGLV